MVGIFHGELFGHNQMVTQIVCYNVAVHINISPWKARDPY